MLNVLKKTLLMFVMCLCMSVGVAPAVEAAAPIQAEAQIVPEEPAAESADSEEGAFLLILMGGALLIILFAVISAMATVSGAISVAVNMDVDGE